MLSPSWSPALADTGSPELSPPIAASPLPSLPSTLAPPPTEVVLPPANSAASPVLSPPSPPAVVMPPLTSPPRPAAMVPPLSSLSPPAAVVPPLTSPPPPVAVVPPVVPTPVAVMPPLTSPPPPTTDEATPPFASSQPRPRPPALLTPPSQLPTPPLVPATPPESSMLPGTSPPPLATPLMPTISPPSPLASSSPLVIGPPPPGAAARTLPRTPTPFFTSLPTQPPPPLPVVEIPGSPAGSLQSPPLSLPLVNLPPNLPAKEPSHVYMGLVFGVVIGGVLLLVLLALLFICYRATSRTPDKDVSCGPHSLRADNLFDVLHQHSQENVEQAGAHVIVAPPKHLLRLPCTKNNGSGIFNYSGSMNPIPTHTVDVSLSLSRGTFTYDELVAATNGFSAANLLGEGGFGYVHKGALANGKEVAVKQLKTGSHQGEREFQAEVEVISTVHHKHLVTLVGYCITGVQRLLVYEFVPNNTLEFHLHGKERPTLEWETRLKIAIGSARGLAYLHEDCNPTIIHRDIKAANILLDSKFEAKVSDFGLAKFFSATNTPMTHISTRVVGTFGYLAPEYASSGKLTDKSDVYSYGVMLLELITGCLPIITRNESLMNESLVNWARPLLAKALEDENFDALVDPKLQSQYNPTEMACMVACAAACVRHSAWLRPRMSQVVRALEGDVPLPRFDEGVMPGRSTLYSSTESSTYNAHQYGNHLKRFNMILANEHGFSGCSGTTSEYGLHPSISSSEFQ